MTHEAFKKLIQTECAKRLNLDRKQRSLHRTLRSFARTHRAPFSLVYFTQGAEFAFKLLEEAYAKRKVQTPATEADNEDPLLLEQPLE